MAINDIGENWRDHKEIAGSLWMWPEREATDYEGMHGQFIPQVARALIERYTHTGDLVIDLFAGHGTTLHEAARLGRYALGVDIRVEATRTIKRDLRSAGFAKSTRVVWADSAAYVTKEVVERAALRLCSKRAAALTILHPPYLNAIRFSAAERDLSTMDHDTFLTRWLGVCYNALDATSVGGWVALVIGDVYQDGRLIPLGFECMSALQDVGLTLKAINIKNIVHNEKGSGNPGLWQYRALSQGYSVFQHEYIMVLRRES